MQYCFSTGLRGPPVGPKVLLFYALLLKVKKESNPATRHGGAWGKEV
jgi:hypothetical protein